MLSDVNRARNKRRRYNLSACGRGTPLEMMAPRGRSRARTGNKAELSESIVGPISQHGNASADGARLTWLHEGLNRHRAMPEKKHFDAAAAAEAKNSNLALRYLERNSTKAHFYGIQKDSHADERPN